MKNRYADRIKALVPKVRFVIKRKGEYRPASHANRAQAVLMAVRAVSIGTAKPVPVEKFTPEQHAAFEKALAALEANPDLHVKYWQQYETLRFTEGTGVFR